MPLLDELVNHARAEATRLARTPFAEAIAADVKHLEALVAKRAQAAHAAFHQAETEARDWLTSRLHRTERTLDDVADTPADDAVASARPVTAPPV